MRKKTVVLAKAKSFILLTGLLRVKQNFLLPHLFIVWFINISSIFTFQIRPAIFCLQLVGSGFAIRSRLCNYDNIWTFQITIRKIQGILLVSWIVVNLICQRAHSVLLGRQPYSSALGNTGIVGKQIRVDFFFWEQSVSDLFNSSMNMLEGTMSERIANL